MNAACFAIKGGDYEHGGSASRSVKEMLKKVGADPAVVRRAMIATYEAEMNVVIHSHGGELRAKLQDGRLDVEVIDEGPGIPDIEKAMRAGFSTASATARELGFGAGMGLPNIKKNSDRFAIESAAGRGTHLSFTIALKPQALYGAGRHSIAVVPEKCRQSLGCLHACPTNAVRVFRGKPEILDYLCVDCGACIAVCPTGALTVAGSPEEFKPSAGAVLVVSPESLVQFGAGVRPRRVLRELAALGWDDVRVTDGWEIALRSAVVEYGGTEARPLPVISPACPAVVNLIEARFPSLIPHLAPFVSAVEAAQAELRGKQAVFVASCPCQITALLGGEPGAGPRVTLPAALRAVVNPRVMSSEGRTAADAGERDSSPQSPRGWPAEGQDVLRVTGLQHVVNILEEIENGVAGDVTIVEPWVCDEGCFGSPLWVEDAFLARRRWESSGFSLEPRASAGAVRRTQAFAPRPGLRLDNDMAKAIQKLARIDKLKRGLPGSNCGICGAPTCAALAEDIVLGRAHTDACPRLSGGSAGAAPANKEKPT